MENVSRKSDCPPIYHQVQAPVSAEFKSSSATTSYQQNHLSRITNRLRRSSKADEEGRTRFSSGSQSGGWRSHSGKSPSASPSASSSSVSSKTRPASARVSGHLQRPLPPPPPAQYRFGSLLRESVPAMPPGLLAKINLAGPRCGAGGRFASSFSSSSHSSVSTGDVKVILCVKMPNVGSSNSSEVASSNAPCVSIDPRRRHVTLVHPAPSRRRFSLAAPKNFTFDAVLTEEDPLAEVCSNSLTDAVNSVVQGTDSCVLSFGHSKTGKSRTMLGSDSSVTTVGVIPNAIAWLFRLMEERKAATNTRFSIRISAVEVFGPGETFNDLLKESGLECAEETIHGPAPGSFLRDSRATSHSSGSRRQMSSTTNSFARNRTNPAEQLSQAFDTLTELRATTVDNGAHILDVALANRTHSVSISHTLFTLHVYQYKVEKKTGAETEVSGGRSRLHLLHLGSGRYSTKDQDAGTTPLKSLSLANMANVLLGLLTGQRHLPHRESAVTQLLREAMTGNRSQPCIIAHVSAQQQHYSETLQVVQLASRLHRLRRRRVGSSGGGGGSSTSGSLVTLSGTTSDSSASGRSFRHLGSARPRLGRSSFGTSTTDYTSSSEQSCAGETVIYLGVSEPESHSPLGPRGLADGSVVHSADEWKRYASSSGGEDNCGTFKFSAGSVKGRLGRSLSQSESAGTLRAAGGGLIKRVTPRTNATAWPRAAAVRKGKDVVNSTAETWVDGPNALAAQSDEIPPPEEQQEQQEPPPPAPPYFGVTHRLVPEQSQNTDIKCANTFKAPMEEKQKEMSAAVVEVKEPTYVSIDDDALETGDANSDSGSCSSSCSSGASSCGSSSGDGKPSGSRKESPSGTSVVGGRGFAVLSDISERTEETEGGTTAPSSVTGGGQEERENTLLDLAIQQSALCGGNPINHSNGDESKFNWSSLSDDFFDTPQISFLRSSYATPQLSRATIGDETVPACEVDEPKTPVYRARSPKTPTPALQDKATATADYSTEVPTPLTPTSRSDRASRPRDSSPVRPSSLSPAACHRCKTPNASASFERVAAWVKDVSSDLGLPKTPDRVDDTRSTHSSSCHRSCCSRRHRKSHRNSRSRRHRHSPKNKHRSSCSKCSAKQLEKGCALCDAESSSKTTCRARCACCEVGEKVTKRSGSRRGSDQSVTCSEISRPDQGKREPTSKHHQWPTSQRHHSAEKVSLAASAAADTPTIIQRTVSFPWMPSQPSAAPFSQCQPPIAPIQQQQQQLFWSPTHYQPPPMAYYNPPPLVATAWSLPTSPYLQSSMQAWSAQMPFPSSANSEMSQAPSLTVANLPPQQEHQQPAQDATSEPPQEARRSTSRFFTLPSIFGALRRWYATRKRRRARRMGPGSETVEVSRGRSTASLPGPYAATGLPNAPNSDNGILRQQSRQQFYDRQTHQAGFPQVAQQHQIELADSSAFMSRMHQSLSNYRTSTRPAIICHKESRGDRESSGYESFRQGGGAPGSEVSSAHTDSIDSCCSACQTNQFQAPFQQAPRFLPPIHQPHNNLQQQQQQHPSIGNFCPRPTPQTTSYQNCPLTVSSPQHRQ